MTLEEIVKSELLKSAALAVFGGTTDDHYRKLRSEFHPDRYPFNSPGQALAEIVFKKLEQLWELLQEPTIILEGKLGTGVSYSLGDKLGTGDISDVYRATYNGSADYIAKISRVPGGDRFISLESQVLKRLQERAKDKTYSSYFPRLVESFLHQNTLTDKFLKRVNIFREPYRLWSLEDVLKKHPGGLDGRHIAWIFRRVLTALGFAHNNNICHGAVLPQHILIEPKNHGICLCGWIHWAEPGTLISTVPETHKSWYPKEVLEHEYAGPETDIFLLAKTMLAASRKDYPGILPVAFKLFFDSLAFDSVAMRPNNAWGVEQEFTELMDSVYGPRKFVVLNME